MWVDTRSGLQSYYPSKKDEEKALATMEAKLSKMLSDEKQVELELDEIASLLED